MSGPEDRILGIVVEILETQGYDAVQLREVARRARVSLATIYKRYVTRDELILAALDAWMAENRYSGVVSHSREPGESLYTALMSLYRTLFEPWERHPAMLIAYVRARSAPGGEKLMRRGLDVVGPAMRAALSDVDEGFIADLDVIISNLIYGLSARFAAGEIAITDILPSLDRAVYWLTSGYEANPGARPAT
ncbi:MAG: TetR/AcrR family transcriptional regulator [Actinomycetota bacterium]|nr:TetR/AcrR family transcriptional regulator [Actinomycetota bacterium]